MRRAGPAAQRGDGAPAHGGARGVRRARGRPPAGARSALLPYDGQALLAPAPRPAPTPGRRSRPGASRSRRPDRAGRRRPGLSLPERGNSGCTRCVDHSPRSASQEVRHSLVPAAGRPARHPRLPRPRRHSPRARFRELVEPLRDVATAITQAETAGADSSAHAAFVLVVTREIVPPESTVPLLRLWGPRGPGSKPGRVDRNHGEGDLADYHPIEGCEPPGAAYLLVDVERGEEFCNVRPEEAIRDGPQPGPHTADDRRGHRAGHAGAAAAGEEQVLHARRLAPHWHSGDRRVPAMWISERAPKLGWCWDGNPHTWLGMASAGRRIA